MANNRLYLKNTRTNERFYLAKYYPSTGWYVTKDELREALNAWFDGQDFGHLTPEQREENARHHGLGVPHPSAGGMYGAEMVLEWEVEPNE